MFSWASSAQPTTYLGGEPTARDKKPSSLKVTQCIALGTAIPSICQTRCPILGGHQDSLDRPRWNLLLLEQMKYISKFRTSSCSQITDQDYRIKAKKTKNHGKDSILFKGIQCFSCNLALNTTTSHSITIPSYS